mmetsp:Transcript_34718/g.81055  ORF Transcript_34718/g.81055 Transcript_34718/m.81055 type:complete len:772 (+) Transcript_34718:87-2402(+)
MALFSQPLGDVFQTPNAVVEITDGAVERLLSGTQRESPTIVVKLVEEAGVTAPSLLKVTVADMTHCITGLVQKDGPFRDVIEGGQLVVGAVLRITKWDFQAPGNIQGQTRMLLRVVDGQYLGQAPQEVVTAQVQKAPQPLADPVQAARLQPTLQAGNPNGGPVTPGPADGGFQTPPPRRMGSEVGSDVKVNPVLGAALERSEGHGIQTSSAASAMKGLFDGVAGRELFAQTKGIDEEPDTPPTQPANIYATSSLGSRANTLSARVGAERSSSASSFAGRFQAQLPGQRSIVARADDSTMPINVLSPYVSRWKIKARVTSKADIRKFTNSRGEGQFFKVDLQDHSGSITATFFGKSVPVNFPRLRLNKVYFFSRGSVKPANKRFDRGEFVLNFDEHAIIEETEDDAEIPSTSYNFLPIGEVQSQETGINVDVAGIISQVREVSMITLKTGPNSGQERPKRELVLWDESSGGLGSTVEVTLWGDKAHMDFSLEGVVFVKNVTVREWNGRFSVSSGSATSIEVNPDHPKAVDLVCKWEASGKPGLGQSMAPAKSSSAAAASHAELIEDVRERSLSLGIPQVTGQDANPGVQRYTIFGTLSQVNIDRPPFYPACPELVERASMGGTQVQDTQGGAGAARRTCNKKMTQEADGSWKCSAHHVHAAPTYRYLCRFQVCDCTGALDIQAFDESASKLFGVSANEVAAQWELEGDLSRTAAEKLHQPLWKPLMLKLRAQKETYNSEERIKYAIMDSAPVTHATEAKRKLGDIHAVLGQF